MTQPPSAVFAAESVWWQGRLHTGSALLVSPDGVTSLVAAPGEVTRLPGTLLPGLTDAHVHLDLVDAATLRAGGIAAVWDLGGVSAKRAAPAFAGLPRYAPPPLPHIRYAGPFLIAPGGYPSDRAWAAPGSWREIHSPSDGSSAVAEAHAGSATLIKVTAHAGGPLLPLKTMTAIAAAAHALSLPVVVHAEGPGTVELALDAGADLLAHTPWTSPLTPDLARECAARLKWISTLDIHGWGTPTPAWHTAIANLRLFLSHGGTVLYGTDQGNGPLPPAINPREIRALQKAGLSPAEILTTMTGPGISWLPTPLSLEPSTFPNSLTAARVLS